MGVVQVGRKFCETTTIRGIGRAIKAEKRIISAIWWISVIICTGFLVYQLFLVLSKYFRYEFQIIDRESNARPIFPDITFCNVNPLVTKYESRTWDEYRSYMKNKKSRWTYEKLDSELHVELARDDYNQLWIDLASPTAYFANFPILKSTTLNRSDPNNDELLKTVVDINVFDWSWTFDEKASKYSLEHVQLKWNPDYHHCYTLQIPENYSQNVRAMSFIVYIDDFDASIVDKFSANPRRSTSTGIRLAVHERDTTPDLSNGVSIGPGTDTSITVSTVLRRRLGKPFDECTQDKVGHGGNEICSRTECIEECLQDKFERVNYTVCRNQSWVEYNEADQDQSSSNELKAIQKLLCFYNLEPNWDECLDKCAPPCSELQYYTTTSQSQPWPHTSYQLALYRQYIAHNADRSRFTDYDDINDRLQAEEISGKEAIARLGQLNLIEKNFLQVNVLMDNYVYNILDEVPSMPNEVLLSNIGGVLSLWLGITVMTIIEVTEAVYFLLAGLYENRCNKKTVPVGDNSDDFPTAVAVTSKAL